jgi:hypothetical protein
MVAGRCKVDWEFVFKKFVAIFGNVSCTMSVIGKIFLRSQQGIWQSRDESAKHDIVSNNWN